MCINYATMGMAWKTKRLQTFFCIAMTSILLLVVMGLLQSQFSISKKSSGKISQATISTSQTIQSQIKFQRKQDYSCHDINSIPFRHTDELHVLFIFHNAEPHGSLMNSFHRCVGSIFAKTLKPFAKITCHIIGDFQSFQLAKEVFQDLKLYNLIKLEHHSHTALQEKARSLLSPLLQSLSINKHDFSDPLFFLSTVLHRLLPRNISKLVMLDIDLMFKSDIADLFTLFDKFTEDQVISIARENQPVYRHVFREFRLGNPDSKIGEPPPDGVTGVNSGVLLLDLDKLRCSDAYNSMFLPNHIPDLVKNYSIQAHAHLGDQDFYTLVQLEKPELLHLLPCGWNRQLCQFWRMDEFKDIFDLFYRCPGPIHVFHGNCKSSLTGVR